MENQKQTLTAAIAHAYSGAKVSTDLPDVSAWPENSTENQTDQNGRKIKSFEEACAALGLDPTKVLPDVSNMPEQDQKAITAFSKMCINHRALNGDWKADWSDYDQRKYYPWFDVEEKEEGSSGFGLSVDDYVYASTITGHGVRLFYPDADTARYAGETFKELYEDMILLPK